MTWSAPWRSRALAACAAHAGDEPFRVLAVTLVDGRCVQCVATKRVAPEEQLVLTIDDGEADDGVVG